MDTAEIIVRRIKRDRRLYPKASLAQQDTRYG
jgi:hypothetical protein